MATLNISEELHRRIHQQAAEHGVSVETWLAAQIEQPVDESVSERKEREQREREQRETLAVSLQAANAGVWTWEIAGDRVTWDTKMEAIYGLKPGTFGGNSAAWDRLLHPESQAAAQQAINAAIRGDAPFNVEVRTRRVDGTERILLSQAVVIHDQQTGEPLRMIGVNIDITERKQAEIALRQSEALYRTIAENFPNGMLAMYDHDLRYTVINGKGLAAIGLTPADLEGKRLRDVFPPEIYQRDEPALLAALRGESTEAVIPFADGCYRVMTVPVVDQQGTIMGGMVMSQNITPLKEAENRLRETIDQLELALSTAKLGVWLLDPGAERSTWNAQLHEIFGITPEELAQNPDLWRELIHPDDREETLAGIAEIGADEQVTTVRFRVVRRDGELRHVVASGRALCDEDGNIVKVIGINQDITDFKRSKQALEASEARYRALFNGFINPIVIYDEEARILMLNPIAAKNLGVTPQAAIGTKLSDYFPQNQQITVERIAQARQTNASFIVEDQVDLPEGGTRWFWSVVQPVIYQGVKGAQIVSYDITERKEADQREEERQRLQRDLEREQFIAQQNARLISVISHEFRTPMTIMKSSSELMTKYHDRMTRDMLKEKVDRIGEQIDQLSEMLDEIDRLSRANRGFLDYQPEHTDISELCQSILDELSESIGSNHRLTYAPVKPGAQAVLDRKLLHHALTNLLANAIKYSDVKSAIHLSVKRVDEFWQFSVSDHGIGIPEEDQSNLFQPFARASNVGTIRGTGIGLSIVKEVAEYHQGWVDFHSELGVGSTFTLAIPVNLRGQNNEDSDR